MPGAAAQYTSLLAVISLYVSIRALVVESMGLRQEAIMFVLPFGYATKGVSVCAV